MSIKPDNSHVIEVTDLKKHFIGKQTEDVKAVDGVSFQVNNGELFGLLGPNGAVKTTIIHILTVFFHQPMGLRLLVGIT